MIAHRAKMKYMDWLAQWLENYVRPSVKARTYEHYKRIAEQHIRGKIGGLALRRVERRQGGVRAFLSAQL